MNKAAKPDRDKKKYPRENLINLLRQPRTDKDSKKELKTNSLIYIQHIGRQQQQKTSKTKKAK